MIKPPPKPGELLAGTKLKAGLGASTILPDIDFETYSPLDITEVGAARYSEHPETDILCLAFNLKNGKRPVLWKSSDLSILHRFILAPLFDYVRDGGIVEAWNSSFEYFIWNNVGCRKYGFPPLHYSQLRDAAAKARAFAIPGKLEKAGDVLNVTAKKDKDGMRLINKFSKPRKPTIKDGRIRNMLADDPEDAQRLFDYCLRDIESESEISGLCPDLTPDELQFWLCDQAINFRGVQIDLPLVEAAIKIVDQALLKYNAELFQLTEGRIKTAAQVGELKDWINEQLKISKSGLRSISDLQQETVLQALANRTIPREVKRALEIRQLINSAAVKKIYSMRDQVCRDGRLRNLFIYHSARTGRAAGVGPQPQNLPNSGPVVYECLNCLEKFGTHLEICPWCAKGVKFGTVVLKCGTVEWDAGCVQDALKTIAPGSLELTEYYWGDALEVISGCLRGLFIAAPGHDLICSDYSAIEAVVLAALAGEEWRLEVFRTHGKIYEMSASKITGIPFEEFEKHKQEHQGQNHPMRKKVGKVAELASGYGGGYRAWMRFGADEFFTEDEIKLKVTAWRQANPAIVNFWRNVENAVINAIKNPGYVFPVGLISYVCRGDILYCKLPSDSYITYHKPQLIPAANNWGNPSISFEGWNTNQKYGPPGWVRMDTYGGKLVENIVQKVARDILAHAIVNLEEAAYPIVLHIHDEICSEITEGRGSIEEFEQILNKLPSWAANWPVKAVGGWRGKRYRK